MREVSLANIYEAKGEKENKDLADALKKINEALATIAGHNVQVANALAEAMKNIPAPQPIDLTPVIEAAKPEQPQSYIFDINRDGSGKMTSVLARPKL